MQQSFSARAVPPEVARLRLRVRQAVQWQALPYDLNARVSLWVSTLLVAVLFGWGAWQRRWMADDGLIVLRTVRNLLAGNGPVFNEGERVEANTSTAWTYLIYLGGWVGGPVRLEYVALALALTLSVLGVALLMLGTGRLYAPRLQGGRALLLPAGALVYIAVPPARDFATSGLENGLVLAYLGLLWWMMVCWSQVPQSPQGPQSRFGGQWFTLTLAFVAGLSVLVRPELALIGGLALVMMVIAVRDWRSRLFIVLAGGLLPVVYQLFRMGYYGLVVPQTAVAKDASGSKWPQGLVYLADFNRSYAMWVPALLLLTLGLVLMFSVGYPQRTRRVAPIHSSGLARAVQSPAAVVIFITVSGLLQAIYWIRQGGDFMHGRVLLTPLFCLLAPVAVIPIVIRDGANLSKETGYWLAGATSVLWLAVAGWSLWAANSAGMGSDATRVTDSGIVDERRFYAQATGNAHPLTAADYLDYPRMRAVLAALGDTPDGALLLPSGNYDQWDIVPLIPPPPPPPGTSPDQIVPDQFHPEDGQHTVFFTNMGMLGMNVGLDVRVVDQIGLVNTLAAHTERLEDGRIGHDKNLFADWAVAEGPFEKAHPFVPSYIDEDWIAQAEVALTCPATEAILTSVRGPMGPRRFLSNLLHSYQFTIYRIDRVPQYELLRCGLDAPELGSTPYTGLPAAGP